MLLDDTELSQNTSVLEKKLTNSFECKERIFVGTVLYES